MNDAESSGSLQLNFSGSFRALLDGEQIPIPSRKLQVLLAYLALTGRSHPRESLAERIWDDRDQDQALSNLRTMLSRLPKPIRPFLNITRQSVGLNPKARIRVDVLEFNRLAASQNLSEQRDALSRYQGDFLEGVFVRESRELEEWMLLQREALREKALALHFHLARAALHSLKPESGLPHARAVIRLDPLRESGRRLLMRLLARCERFNAAIGTFGDYEALAEKELDAPPVEETIRVFERIRAARERARPVLPAHPTPFVGREEKIRTLSELLEQDEQRLITLIGMGGAGKTRLAYRAAELCRADYLDGVYLVPLASLTGPRDLPLAVADGVGLELQGIRSTDDQLFEYLSQRECLLVLDNLEQFLPEAAHWIHELISRTRRLRVLATSRERLNLVYEQVVPVLGLAYGDGPVSDAFVLFRASVARTHPGFSPDESQAVEIDRICGLLQGFPLAIELAAAWAARIPLGQLRKDLGDGLERLATHEIGRPDRHRSLEAAFAYSWERLPADERAALLRLSEFRGGFDPAAARSVAGASRALLSALEEKSFLTADPNRARFSMLEVLRQFISDRWETGADRDEIRAGHQRWFSRRAAQAEQELLTDRNSALASLGADLENYRRAWRRLLRHEPFQEDEFTPFVECLFQLYHSRSWFTEGYALFGEAVEKLEALPESPGRARQLARLLARQGNIAAYLGRLEDSHEQLERGRKIGRGLLPARERAALLVSLSQTALLRGQLDLAQETAVEAAELFKELDDARGRTVAFRKLASVALDRGQFAEAEGYYTECLHISRELGDQVGIARALNGSGSAVSEQGRYEEAAAYYREALEIYRRLENRYSEALVLNNLGTLDNNRGRFPRAIERFREAQSICEDIGDEPGLAIAMMNEGVSEQKLDSLERSAALFKKSIEIYRQIDYPYMLAMGLYGLGINLAKAGDPDRSAEMIRAGLAVAGEIQSEPRLIQGLLAAAYLREAQGEMVEALALALVSQHHPALYHEMQAEAEALAGALAAGLSAEEIDAARALQKRIDPAAWADAFIREGEQHD